MQQTHTGLNELIKHFSVLSVCQFYAILPFGKFYILFIHLFLFLILAVWHFQFVQFCVSPCQICSGVLHFLQSRDNNMTTLLPLLCYYLVLVFSVFSLLFPASTAPDFGSLFLILLTNFSIKFKTEIICRFFLKQTPIVVEKADVGLLLLDCVHTQFGNELSFMYLTPADLL